MAKQCTREVQKSRDKEGGESIARRTPIRCDEVDLEQVLSSFSGSKAPSPCHYLGL